MNQDQAYNAVLDTLFRATSQNSDVLKPAEKQLHEWETQQGFYTVLLNVFSDKTLDVNVRWLAVLYFKNGVDRYWRRHSPGAISEEEKVMMRKQLISNFHEPVNPLATQLAVLVGKIARLDCPKQWPELLPTLIQAVTTCTDELIQQRILLTFYQVIKCLSSRRLAHDRKVFEELTSEIFEFVLSLWNNQMTHFDNYVSQNDVRGAQVMLEYAHLTLKVLRKLVVYGFKDPSKNTNAKNFLHQCLQCIEKVGLAKQIFDVNTHMNDKRAKLLLLFTKILLDMLQFHAETYIEFIIPTLQLVVKFCFSQVQPLVPEYERFNVNMLNLVKDIIKNDTYRPTMNRDAENNQLAISAHKCILSFMTPQTLTEIVNRIIYNYLPLTQADLELWDTDPEEYVNEEGGDSWKYSIRACVETLYVTLFKEFRQVVEPVLLTVVKDTEKPCDASDVPEVLKRDALYNAVGLANYEIYEDVDFDNWMKNHLINELNNQHTNYRIIRRRVIWLIGNWISVKVPVDSRTLIYNVVLNLLREDEDLVVRLEAALTLRAAIDDVEFSAAQFAPYLEPSFSMLFKLLTNVDSCDSKMQVLHVMSFLIERVGADIVPHSQALMQHLPLLWQESEDHNLLRCAIVTTLVNLIEGLQESSVQLHSIVIPVVRLSTDTSQDAHIYLLEDGLNLWKVLLFYSKEATPDILSLFSAMPSLLELGTENLRTCLKIMEAYALLCGEQLIMTYGEVLVNSLCSLVGDLKPEGVAIVLKTVEVFFKLYPRQSAVMFKGLFVKRIIPGILEGEEYPLVLALYLCLVSRVTVEDRNLFFVYLMEYAKSENKQNEHVLNDFLQLWFEKLDFINQPERRKLNAIAIATLISTALGSNLSTLDPMVNACVQVLHDVCQENDNGVMEDSLILDPAAVNLNPANADSPHEKRKLELSQRDVVFHIKLDQFVWNKLSELRNMIHEENFQQLMSNIDVDIKSQLHIFIKNYIRS